MNLGFSAEKNLWIHVELVFVVAIWAGTFVATKMVLSEITPAVSALYRYLIASAILIIIDYRNPERVKRQDYPLFAFLSLTGVTLYYLLQHYGIQYTNATEAAILISLSPVFIGLISWVMLGEPLRKVTTAGLLLSFFGTLMIITNGQLNFEHMDDHILGNTLILATAITWALYSAYGKKLLGMYSVRTIIKYTTVWGTVFILPFTVGDFFDGVQAGLSWYGWLNLLYLGGLASVYGYLAWYRALEKLPAVTVGSYLYFRPLLTGIIAFLVLQEQIGLNTLLGGCLIIIGTYLTTR